MARLAQKSFALKKRVFLCKKRTNMADHLVKVHPAALKLFLILAAKHAVAVDSRLVLDIETHPDRLMFHALPHS